MGIGASQRRDVLKSALAAFVSALWLAACASHTQPTPAPAPTAPVVADSSARLSVVSFNIKFLGHYHARDNAGLAHLLSAYDLVVIQELVAPPNDVETPAHATVAGDADARAFFDAMRAQGFQTELGEAPSGAHATGATSREWPIVFYRSARVAPAPDLAHGYIASPLIANTTFDRVPYAFGFRAHNADFVLISVHLAAATGPAGVSRRARQFSAIWSWVANQNGPERDYIVLGDTNIQNCSERQNLTPPGVTALGPSNPCINTNVLGTHPFDQVMFHTADSGEIAPALSVIPLVQRMQVLWDPAHGAYPGQPFKRTQFEQTFSDHNPIAFEINTSGQDDD